VDFILNMQILLTMSKGCCIWNSFTFGLLVHKKKSLNVFPYGSTPVFRIFGHGLIF